MARIAIVEQLDGKAVDWVEKVSDERYWGASVASHSRPDPVVHEVSVDPHLHICTSAR